MDFEALFWIALVVFYFVMRALGGKKDRRSEGRTQGHPERDAGRPGRETEPELDDALREIRRALGFPEEKTPADAGPTPASRREPAAGPGTGADRPTRTLDGRASRHSAGDRGMADAERERRQAKMRDAVREQEERKRQIEQRQAELGAGSERMAAKTGDSLGTSRRKRAALSDASQALEASFGEEEAFERAGRHPHVDRRGLRVASPYDAPARKQLPGVMRRLSRRSSLREAFLMKEILDRPRALRRRK